MRALLALALVGGCADDGAPDPHEIVECGDRWGASGQCERGCLAPMPDELPPDRCPVTLDDGRRTNCGAVGSLVIEDGTYGCCALGGESLPYHYVYRACE